MLSNTYMNAGGQPGLGSQASGSATTGVNPATPINSMMPATASPIQAQPTSPINSMMPTVSSPLPPPPIATPQQNVPSISGPYGGTSSSGVGLGIGSQQYQNAPNPASGISNNMMPAGFGAPTIANRTPYGSQMGGATMLMAKGGGVKNSSAGGFDMTKSPHLGIGAGAGSRQLHVGPIISSVPGRTDHHPVKVPSGSYVLPSDLVSGHGQGNTLAGMNVLQKMFKMGPFSSGPPMGIKGGRGAPPPPKPFKMATGGSADNAGVPVPVNVAGGELIIPPENLIQTVHPDLDTAHRIMDAFVLHSRKNLRKTLANLPGPSKD